MASIKHKRGDTLDWAVTYKIGNIATSVAAIDIACQVKTELDTILATSTGLTPDITITKLNQITSPGQYTIYITDSVTELWPIAKYYVDIQYTDQGTGKVMSTDTFILNVIKDITIV